MRLGPKIIYANFGEDWANIVACEFFFNLSIKIQYGNHINSVDMKSWPWGLSRYHQTQEYIFLNEHITSY